jgi:hypothetical protein
MNQPTPMFRFVDGQMQVGVLVDGMVQRTLEDGTQEFYPIIPGCEREWERSDVLAAATELFTAGDNIFERMEAVAAYFTEKGRMLGVKQVGDREKRLEDVLRELLEVADLRGDSDLPHPSDDPLLWTARMQTAWDEARAALAKVEDSTDE